MQVRGGYSNVKRCSRCKGMEYRREDVESIRRDKGAM